ncbi:T9SS type A sorting domain-containing protein [Paracnuella aquatica]|uniref:T9SS type A sorting domain-containing protein n=1 Tax=Paracnuella aquatica TaxID=2268757 RepID=UPI000DEF0480|nr:T9SS type A sorting domain-containing protein [Paracnuella aquatica]RPD43711.1 T9SS C-terminal target domain-containing protein [Paracnuella aquatica]
MKNFYTTLIAIALFFGANAQQVNQLLASNNIADAKSWSQKRMPLTGDTVVIPSTAVYTIKEDVDFSKQDIYVKVEGKVTLDKATIKLSNNSELVLTSKTASINATSGKGNSIIFVGGAEKYKGSQGLEVGPAYINKNVSTFTEFTPTTLPVKFIGFSVARATTGSMVKWATSEEINASHYDVERSEDGTNWKKIAAVFAIGNSTNVNSYSYTDRSSVNRIAYFRIRQVDIDGRFTYTAVKTITTANTAAAQVSISSTTGNFVLIQLAQQISTPVQVRIITMNGQVVSQQEFKQTGSQIILPKGAAASGAYIVSLTGGSNLNVSKQVML